MGSVDDKVRLMALTIRESLMEYYKGTCIRRLTDSSPVDLLEVETVSRNAHYYLRREAEISRKRLLTYDGVPIASLCKSPLTIKFEPTAVATKDLAKVKEQLQDFLRTYLAGVKEI